MPWADGACVVDTRTGRVGQVTARLGPRLRLRPLGGGRAWDCPAEAVRRATEFERRNADVLNAARRFYRPARP
jgi:hypothetical protein